MCRTILYAFLFFSITAIGQNFSDDSKYLEDQFYAGITYNVLRNKPNDLKQQNLSYGLYAGFIRDIPFNTNRTTGLGIGLGYATNSYYTNLKAVKTGNNVTYSFIEDDVEYMRNKIEVHSIEMPIQLRWRESSPNNHKFLRIYGGFKLGYAFAVNSKYVAPSEKTIFTNEDIQRFNYGLQLNIGYNTWNAYVYYGINGLFKDGTSSMNGTNINMKPIHLGLTFYIL